MKRTELKRKTPMKRSAKPLARSAIKPGRKRTLKARPPSPAERVRRDEVRAAVFARDGHRCRLAGVPGAGVCFGPLTYHHRRKNGQGGEYTEANGATLCSSHNDRLEADADLAAIAKAMIPPLVLDRYMALVEHFWSLVDDNGPVNDWRPDLGPCAIWTGPATKDGYGCLWDGNTNVYAHRFALGLVEELIAGLEVDHLCRVRRCVRRTHLEQVTPTENRKRQAAARPDSEACAAGHPWTDENTGRKKSNGTRYCRACKRDRERRNRG